MKDGQIDCIADTSTVIDLSRHRPQAVEAMNDRYFCITFITVAELQLGIRKARNRRAAWHSIEAVMEGRQVLYPSELTPLVYADVCHSLEAIGARIPSNDMWIAALAVENALPLGLHATGIAPGLVLWN